MVASPTFPAGSVALTPKLCRPSTRPEYALGLVQGVNWSVSSRHSNVLPALFEVKTKVALVWLVGSGGSDAGSIVTTGSVRSIVHVYDVEALSLPAGSTALTVKVCVPSARSL